MASPFLRKSTGSVQGMSFQLLDGATPVNKLVLSGLSDTFVLPTEPKVTADLEDFLIAGVLKGRTSGDDSVTTNNYTFQIFALDDAVTSGKFDIEKFVLNKKNSADADLVSLNTGSVVISDINGKDKTISISSEHFLLKLEMLIHGENPGTSDIGYSQLVHVVRIDPIDINNKLGYEIEIMPFSRRETITALTV